MDPIGEPLPNGADRFLLAFSGHFVVLMKTIEFGAAAECFDATCWARPAPKSDVLVLCAGTPSAAIDRLLSYSEQRPNYIGLETSKLDCVEIIEVCRWLAERDVIGVAAFNLKYGGASFKLAAPGSTGVISMALACRDKGNGGDNGDRSYYDAGGPLVGAMVVTLAGVKKGDLVDLAMCLGGLPIGSRVMWRNFDRNVHPDDDFKNENTVKIGDNLYAAHPLGIFSLQEMGLRFARPHYDDTLERIAQLTEDLAEAQQEMVALQSALDAHGEGATHGDKVSGEPEGAIVASALVVGDDQPASIMPGADQPGGKGTTGVVEFDAEKVRSAINRRIRRIRRIQRALAYYHGINSFADYIARFIRVVEAETFVNPCGDL